MIRQAVQLRRLSSGAVTFLWYALPSTAMTKLSITVAGCAAVRAGSSSLRASSHVTTTPLQL